MSNHLESLLSAILVPSERIEFESKKNFDSFFKNFRKKKRIISTKLNKNQINLSQAITFHENLIKSLVNVKKLRIENIITLNDYLFEGINYSTNVNNLENVESALFSKPILEEILEISPKRRKLISLDEEVNRKHSCTSNATYTNNVDEISENTIGNRITCDRTCDKSVESAPKDVSSPIGGHLTPKISNNQFDFNAVALPKILKKNLVEDVIKPGSISNDVLAEVDESEDMCLDEIAQLKDGDDQPCINTVSIVESISTNKSVDDKIVNKSKISEDIVKKHDTSNVFKPNISQFSQDKSSMKTPQALYKNKYHAAFSNSKNQTFSQTKTPNTNFKGSVSKLDVSKVQNYKDRSRPKLISMPSSSKINSSAKVVGLVSKKTPSVPRVIQKTSKGGPTLLKTTALLSHKKPCVGQAINPKTFPQKTVPSSLLKATSDEKIPKSILQLKNQAMSKLPPPQNDTIGDNVFKTPFSKKRMTMMTNSCIKIIESHDSYDISDLMDVDSNDEDEYYENKNRHKVPTWSKKSTGTLERLVKYQSKHCIDGKIFRDPGSIAIDPRQIFGDDATVKEGCLEQWISV